MVIKKKDEFLSFFRGLPGVTEKDPSDLYLGRTDLWSAVGMWEWHFIQCNISVIRKLAIARASINISVVKYRKTKVWKRAKQQTK